MRARLLSVALLSPALLAMTSSDATMHLQPGSRLWVSGTSTVRGFECSAGSINAAVTAIGTGTAAAVVKGAKAVSAVEVSVPAAKLDCRNGTMNGHLMKAIKGEQAPVITFRLASYDVDPGTAGATVSMTGTLTLGGVTKPIAVKATAKEEAGALRVTGTHELRMTEFGLKPPTLMMGTMKVNELVKVGFDLQLKD